jgi:hypothetical protein
VLVQHLLDLARVDVVAAADDEVLLAVDDEQVAVVVGVAEVAGVEPAVLERLRRRLGLVVVAPTWSAPAGSGLSLSSTTWTVTPQIGLPIDRTLRCSALMLNVVVLVDSDRPYPSRITQPGNFSSKPRMTSPGIAAPPETPTRSDDRSRPDVSMASSPKYIVGTPLKIVQRCRSMASTTGSSSNRGMSTIVPPKRVVTLRTLDSPKTWNSGSTATPMSSSRNSNSAPATVQFM